MSEWISVEKRLPEYGLRILLFYSMDYKFPDKTKTNKLKNEISCGCLSSTNKYGHVWNIDIKKHCYIFNVTHWMPLPEPPK